MIKRVVKIFVLVLFFSFLPFFVHADDLLMQAFSPAFKHELIINVGSTKESVGSSMIKSRRVYNFNEGKLSSGVQDPLFARISKFLLKFTVILSVTMIIYNAILYAMRVLGGEDYKSKSSLKSLGLIALGLILAFSSIALINLMRSTSVTLLDFLRLG